MKNRLLEDIGDSQSAVPVRPVRRGQAAPPPAPQPPADAAPVHDPVPDGVQVTSVRQRAGVWRSRAPLAPPAPSAPRVTPTIAPAPEPARAAPRVSPELASFSSREPDWPIPPQPDPLPWTERWGRKALGWTIGLAAIVAVAGTAAWMVQETRVESTLAVVADHTPAQASAPAPAMPAAAPLPQADIETLPPLKLLPPEPVPAAPIAAGPAGADKAGVTAAAEAAQVQAPAAAVVAATAAEPAPAKKPAVKRVPERRVAAAAAEKRKRPEAKKPAPKPAREPALARVPAVPVRTAPAQQPDPESPLAETLRLCRAAGYHATACLKRGCEATRFGLVCRG